MQTPNCAVWTTFANNSRLLAVHVQRQDLCAGHLEPALDMANNDNFSLLEDEQSPSEVRARPHSRNANQNMPNAEAQKSQEESLRQELANVKKVNEAIEGVLASLDKAKANMKVQIYFLSRAPPLTGPDCQFYGQRCLVSTQHMDSNPVAD